MQLWTDYEGVLIDGVYPLQKLLMPEGRSAFYSTAGSNGEPTVVRLIECHFDEEEILARWRCVQALHHPNFIRFEHFGQTEIDGRPVVYAVIEKVDANLAEVLDRGNLPVEEVAQLASSLVAALDVLHTHGFIHEHVEPGNIFAVNGAVKLRSDCIREAPEGEEGRAAKQRDVHDLATVLLQALTQRKSLEGIPDYTLAKPFGQIIRNGLSGAWLLENIKSALETYVAPKPLAAPEPLSLSPAAPVRPSGATPVIPAAPEKKASATVASPSAQPEAQLPLPLRSEDPRPDTRNEPWEEGRTSSPRILWIAAGTVIALLLLIFIWPRHKAPQTAVTPQPATHSAPQLPPRISPSPALSQAPSPASTSSHLNWRVIAFTYNRRADAESKVASIARTHPELAPAVFTPSGHAPYLVAIGGVLDRDSAYALARRSRSLGLPRDAFARNFSR